MKCLQGWQREVTPQQCCSARDAGIGNPVLGACTVVLPPPASTTPTGLPGCRELSFAAWFMFKATIHFRRTICPPKLPSAPGDLSSPDLGCTGGDMLLMKESTCRKRHTHYSIRKVTGAVGTEGGCVNIHVLGHFWSCVRRHKETPEIYKALKAQSTPNKWEGGVELTATLLENEAQSMADPLMSAL